MRDATDLYYEAHITVEPVFGDTLHALMVCAERHGFRVADLLLRKREEDTPERSKDDTFCTGRSRSYGDLLIRMRGCIFGLQADGFKVWRYKIEETLIDSREFDVLGLLQEE